MAPRELQRTGWSPIAAVFALIVVAGVFLTFFGPVLCQPPLPALSQPHEQARLLDQYADVIRNLTTRLEVAERAVLEVRRRSKASDRVTGKIRAALLRYAEAQQPPPAITPVSAATSDQSPNDAEAAAQQFRDERQARRKQLRSEHSAGTGADDHKDDATGKAATRSDDFSDNDEGDLDQPAEAFSGDVVQAQAELLKKDEEAYARFRADMKCGSQVPKLADGGPVECDAHGPSPCCSHLGWCGRTRGHCRCKECVIYRAADGGRR